jgi:hypothetical protein
VLVILAFIVTYLPIACPSVSIAWLFVKGITPSAPASPAIAPPIGTPLLGILTIPPTASLGKLNVGSVFKLIPGTLLITPSNLFIALIGEFKMLSIAFKTPLITVLNAPPIASPTFVPIFLNSPTILEIKFEKTIKKEEEDKYNKRYGYLNKKK